tara:strand:+ start:3036 stop:3965 length:930 start_codon:yes stop_codon:yes gene_type:complete
MNANELMEKESEQESVSFEIEDDAPQSAQETIVDQSPVQAESEETSTVVQGEDDSELENYSEKVQKRINQLTAKRKQAIEEAEAAYAYAQQLQQQNEEMKQRMAQLDQGYIAEYDGRVESQTAAAKRMLQEAYDGGDMEKMAQAQELISSLAIEKERLRIQKNRQERQAAQPVQQQVQQPQQPQQPQELDPKLKSWMSKNSWFGTDMFMTRGATAIHEQLVAQEGFDPSSDEYYAEIDRRMRQEMPHKFQEQKQSAQAVAPASNGRSSSKTGRKKTVQLTPGQVRVAERMKIPLEKMAQEVAKLERKAT